MKLNKKGLELVKHFEGCYLKAYRCPAGRLTIGYGHTQGVREGQTLPNELAAHNMLVRDLQMVAAEVTVLLGNTVVNENQFNALVSFAFNCGLGGLAQSTALRWLKEGKIKDAAQALTWWNKATVDGKKTVLKGLVRRREAEKALFLEPVSQDHETLAEIKEMLYNASRLLDEYIKRVEA